MAEGCRSVVEAAGAAFIIGNGKEVNISKCWQINSIYVVWHILCFIITVCCVLFLFLLLLDCFRLVVYVWIIAMRCIDLHCIPVSTYWLINILTCSYSLREPTVVEKK